MSQSKGRVPLLVKSKATRRPAKLSLAPTARARPRPTATAHSTAPTPVPRKRSVDLGAASPTIPIEVKKPIVQPLDLPQPPASGSSTSSPAIIPKVPKRAHAVSSPVKLTDSAVSERETATQDDAKSDGNEKRKRKRTTEKENLSFGKAAPRGRLRRMRPSDAANPRAPVPIISTSGESPESSQKLVPKRRSQRPKLLMKKATPSDEVKFTMRDIALSIPRGKINKSKTTTKESPERPRSRRPSTTEDSSENYGAAPSVRIIDGQIVVDTSSLTISNPTDNPFPENTLDEEVDADDSNGYQAYGRRRKYVAWQEEETRLFFKCLSQFGSDFSTIQMLFPTRTRRQLKLKFKKEERERPQLIEKALKTSLRIDRKIMNNILETIAAEASPEEKESISPEDQDDEDDEEL